MRASARRPTSANESARPGFRATHHWSDLKSCAGEVRPRATLSPLPVTFFIYNWKNGHEVAPVFNSGQVTAVTLNVPLPGPGSYRLVLSNTFSLLTHKTVQVQDVRMTCGA